MKVSKLFYFACLAFVLTALLASGAPAYGQTIPGYPKSITAHDPREIALLPPYCIQAPSFTDVPGANRTEHLRYMTLLGDSFTHMHHYCWAQMQTNRALLLARDPVTRKYYLENSIGDFDYMIRNVSKNFALLPEIHTKKGENLRHLGRMTEALNEFQAAIDLKPDYWPPYVAMIDYYKSVGNLKKAREITAKGLEFSPDSKALRQRMEQFDRTKDQSANAPLASQKKKATPTAPEVQTSPDSASQPPR